MRAGWVLLLGLTIVPGSSHAANPSALWNIVHGQCVPHQEATHDPSPCAVVDIAQGVDKGYAVLKDIVGIAQFLLIPTARVGGIEDPAILAEGETNYWEAAWKARTLVEGRLHTALPREDVSLAINSLSGRTQNQLHIHIDCVRPDIHDLLTANLDKVGDTWSMFPIALSGHTYRSIRINQATLDGVDPFRLLADGDPQAANDMGTHTLVLVGASFSSGASGFVLLDDQADLARLNWGAGEELQDHTCAIATR